MSAAERGGARTLDNGIAVLLAVARSVDGLTVVEAAREVGLDRTVVHRLVTTLTRRDLLRRRADGRFVVGAGILEISAAVRFDLRPAAAAVLPRLARTAGATSHLSVRDVDEVVSVAVVEPPDVLLHVAYRIGSRHRLDQGAAGLAIGLGLPARRGERQALRAARAAGFAVTEGELERGAWGLAAPVRDVSSDEVVASVGVIALRPLDVRRVAPAVVRAAGEIAALASGRP